jgi:hypothetical protein
MCAICFLLPVFAYAQSELVIPPTTGTTFLNAQIEADANRPADRVYVLQRDGVYLMNGRVNNNGWVLRIKAQDGAGKRPVIYLVANATTGTFPPHFFLIGGHLSLKNLTLVSFIEAQPGQIANMPPRNIDVAAAGFDLTIDGCLVTQGRGEHIRFPSAARVVKLINSVFANMGDLGLSNLGAGRCIDMRNTSCDSLIIVNSTFINSQDRIVRHLASVAPIKYFRFDHNTIVNGMTYHGLISLGQVGKEAIVTNNLFIDTNIAGADTDVVRQLEFRESGEVDPRNRDGRIVWILSVPNDTTKWTVAGNYYSVSPAVQAFYNAHAAEGVLGEGPPVTYHINRKIGADSTKAFTKESITLTNTPKPMVAMAEWYRKPTGGNKRKNTPCSCWNRATDDYDRRSWQYFADTLKCTYSASLKAYTGAQKGYPAGDLNWYPDLKAKWEQGLDLTGVKFNPIVVTAYQLGQNYPNPFWSGATSHFAGNPSTNIEFSLAKAGAAKLEIYNALGQKVATLVNGKLPSGQHHVTWDARSVPSGIYFYKLEVENAFSQTRKMVLMK